MKYGRIELFILTIFLCGVRIHAQDTLFVTPKQADSLFLAKNLSLLAYKYEIDISKLLVKQEKIWDNPTFSTELNLYNPEINRWFDVGAGGQKIFTLEQVIKIAGQRNTAAKWAMQNVKISEFEFLDLIRTLKFSLRQNMYALYFNKKTIDIYNRQLDMLDAVIKAYDVQLQKGNIPLKESLRLKAIYYQLNNDKTNLLSEMYAQESALRILLGSARPVYPVISGEYVEKYSIDGLTLPDVQKQAFENRPDLKASSAMYDQSVINLNLQKKNAVPDLRLGGIYDQQGSYIFHYSGITLGMDLPVFNRNQSNIRIARFQIKQAEFELKNDSISVFSEVNMAWDKLRSVEKEYQKIDKDFSSQFELINKGITENFVKRNISVLEFVDLFEAYNDAVNQLNTMQINRILAYEELNYSVGVELFLAQ